MEKFENVVCRLLRMFSSLIPWENPPSSELRGIALKVAQSELVYHWSLSVFLTEERWASLDKIDRFSGGFRPRLRILAFTTYADGSTRPCNTSCFYICLHRCRSQTYVRCWLICPLLIDMTYTNPVQVLNILRKIIAPKSKQMLCKLDNASNCFRDTYVN